MLRPVHAFITVALLTTSCTGVPPYVLTSSDPHTPAGPKIADLMANLKCQLWRAANSDDPLIYYDNRPGRVHHALSRNYDANDRTQPKDADRTFTLRHLFEEIEYVADVQLTLDVRDTGSLNPLASIQKYYSAAAGMLPATGVVLSVGGNLSDAGHRSIQIYMSVDFRRLLESPPYQGNPANYVETRPANHLDAQSPCSGPNGNPTGTELAGDLGLKETIAMAVTANAMNDIGLFPPGAAGGTIPKAVPVTDADSDKLKYTAGVITAQVDFTIVESVNIGPTWTLRYFTGPSSASSGLFGYNRQVTDTLIMTLVPTCIRQKYHVKPLPDPVTGQPSETLGKYDPEFIVGTPGFANLLPPCSASQDERRKPATPTATVGGRRTARDTPIPQPSPPTEPAANLGPAIQGAAVARNYNLLRGLNILGLRP